MPFFNNLCGNLCPSNNNENDFKIDIKLKLNSMEGDIKSITKDITDIRFDITEMKCDMKLGFNSLNNKLDILLSRS